MICPHCQNTIPDGAVYCGACGRRVVGWKGRPRPGRSEPLPDGNVETRQVPPDPRLLEAAGADPARTQKVAPNSHLLRVIRGDPGETRVGAPSPSDLGRARPTGQQGATRPPTVESPGGPSTPPTTTAQGRLPATLEPGVSQSGRTLPPDGISAEDPDASCGRPLTPGIPRAETPDDPTEPVRPLAFRDGPSSASTAYYLEAALRHNRHRVASLLAADAVLVVVGVYLITSWAHRPPRPAMLPPPSPPGRHIGYVDWDDDPTGGHIATGPVHAAFSASGPRGTSTSEPRRRGGRAPRADPRRRPGSRRPTQRRASMLTPSPGRSAGSARPSSLAPKVEISAPARRQFITAVHRRVRQVQRPIRGCYRQVLKLIHTVRGDVDVEITVAPDGHVVRARAARDTTKSTSLVSCILAVFRRLHFPRPPGGQVTLRYPFRFAPGRR